MKLKLLALACACMLAMNANALTVFDPSNFEQNIKQVGHMVESLKTMDKQLQTMKDELLTQQQQLAATTGQRGMQNIQTGVNGQNVPKTWTAMMEGQGTDLKRLASEIKQKAAFLKAQDLQGLGKQAQQLLSEKQDASAKQMAASAAIFEESSQRFTRLQGLMDAIGNTPDLKAINELQARIQAETVMLQNDAMRAQMMLSTIQAEKEVRLQKERESMIMKKR
jgi:type IV secretion system protein VirB5